MRGVKQLGRRLGNWLTPKEGQRLLSAVSTDTLRGKRDAAMLGLLIGCGLRRSELVELDVDRIQQREQRWVILDLIGKGGRVRTVPMPGWCDPYWRSRCLRCLVRHRHGSEQYRTFG